MIITFFDEEWEEIVWLWDNCYSFESFSCDYINGSYDFYVGY